MKQLRRRQTGSGRLQREDALPRWDYQASGERLTAAEERDLALRARRGDREAKERMIHANVPLVAAIARRFRSAYLEKEDLLQEGMIGLCIAIDRFDPDKGWRFSTYATHWIRSRLQRAVDHDARMIRVPVEVNYAARRALALRETMAENLGREPTMAELAREAGISEGRLQAVLECLDDPLSIDDSGDEEARRALEVSDPDEETPEQAALRAEQTRQLDRLLGTLDSRDRTVLESRFELNAGAVEMPELAERVRTTQQGVRQIQRRALLKLRRRIEQPETAPEGIRWEWQ